MFRRSVLLILCLGAGLYALLCTGAYLFQDRLVYFPGPPPSVDPGDLGMEHREVELTAEDGVSLHAWYLVREDAGGAVLVSHGNAGSIEHRLPLARAFLDMGYAVLLYDYRGYGRSGGRPSEEGTYLDAVAAHDFLVAEGFDPGRIAAYGESLGGAVAIELAGRRALGALVTESAFTSLADVGARAYPWLPVRLLARIDYDNARKVERLAVPYLVVHSPGDEIVPVAHGRALVARSGAEWLETEGGHNDGGFLRGPELRARVARFLDRHLGAEEGPEGPNEEPRVPR